MIKAAFAVLAIIVGYSGLIYLADVAGLVHRMKRVARIIVTYWM